MNKDALLASLMRRTKLPRRAAERLLVAVFAELRAGLARGERVELRHFGTFVPRRQQVHVNVHPVTGARREVPARQAVLFRPSKTLRARLGEVSDARP